VIDRVFRTVLDVAWWQAVIFLAIAGLVGAAVGFSFPKYEATAFVSLPQPSSQPQRRTKLATGNIREEPPRDLRGEIARDHDEALDLKGVGFGEFKQVWASYGTSAAFSGFERTLVGSEKAAANVVLGLGQSDDFWRTVATPVLPLSKQDAKDYGELKEESSVNLLGVSISVRDSKAERAEAVVQMLGHYMADGLLRQRIRGWVMQGEMAGVRETELRALDIKLRQEQRLMETRIEDLQVLARRFPRVAGGDGRQVVDVSDGADRFLPPETQLVAAESALSANRVKLAQVQDELLRVGAAAGFFAEAKKTLAVGGTNATQVLSAVKRRAEARLDAKETQESQREVYLRALAAVQGLYVFADAAGQASEIQVEPVKSRTPKYLAALGVMIAFGLLVARKAFRMATAP